MKQYICKNFGIDKGLNKFKREGIIIFQVFFTFFRVYGIKLNFLQFYELIFRLDKIYGRESFSGKG